MELSDRAMSYGMSFDQYVVAILGHLAWRTPFAENRQPWEDWDPDRTVGRPTVVSITRYADFLAI